MTGVAEQRITPARRTTPTPTPRSKVAVALDVYGWQSDLLAGRPTGPLPRGESGQQMSWDMALTYFGPEPLDGPAPACRIHRTTMTTARF
jgi:hypothetical protein